MDSTTITCKGSQSGFTELFPWVYGMISSVPVAILYNSSYDPFPGQSRDFAVSQVSSGAAMTMVDITIKIFFSKISKKRTRTLEFLAAMAPAVIGSLDEFYQFLPNPSKVQDWKDIVAYSTAGLITYLGVCYFRKK